MSIEMKKTILLVEDDAILSLAEAKTIESFGYKVISAFTGIKAVEMAIENHSISLILMDIDLGKGIDGTEAARRILSARKVPIVFLSSHSEREMVEKVHGITRYGYMIKTSGDFVLQSTIEMAYELFETNEKLIDSEESLFTTLQSIGDAVIATDLQGRITRMNPSAERLTGWSFQESKNQPLSDIFRIVNAETHEEVPNPIQIVLEEEKAYGLANHTILIDRGGREYQISDSAAPIRDYKGILKGVILVFSDITEKFRAEEALKDSEEKYKAAFMTSPDAININDMDGRYVDINEGFTRMTGYTREDVIGVLSSEIQIWNIPADRQKLILALKEKSSVDKLESVFRCKDGSLKKGVMSARIIQIHGVPHILSITRDITPRGESAHEQFLMNALMDNFTDQIYMKDRESRFLRISKYSAQKFGLSDPSEAVGKTDFDFFSEEHARQAYEDEQEILRTGQSISKEEKETWADRPDTWISTTKMPLRDDNGNIIGTFGISMDVTGRKLAERALRENEKKYRLLTENIQDVVWTLDVESMRFLYVSPSVWKLLGYTPEEVLSLTLDQILSPEDVEEVKEIIRLHSDNLLNSIESPEKYYTKELIYIRKDGSEVWTEVVTSYYFNENTNQVNVRGVTRDISERKAAEEKIKSLLAEKELLLKEVHHRIKNNMATVVSLLSLQSNRIKNTEANEALKTAAKRILSMQVLYDKLYRSSGFMEISVREYLDLLIEEIVNTFPNRETVKIETKIDDFKLKISVLSPIGMLVNEIITNAMKYAFAGRNDGSISVELTSTDSRARLVIEDNGIGMPESIDLETSGGFGLRLVGLLIKQIEGIVEIDRTNGTKFILEFPN